MFHRLKNTLCVVFFFVSFLAYAEQEEQTAHKTICLNMIVKNESKIITRCLTSTLPLIDYWVIVDTGSTDGTQRVIQDFMHSKGVPGELHERPWVDFAHNRNEALQLAKGKADYVFFIDADEYLTFDPDFKWEEMSLNKDYYYVMISYGGSRYGRIQLVNNHLDWKWVGVLHEVIDPGPNRSSDTLAKVTNVVTTEGARSKDPEKYLKDAQVLEAALKKEPDNKRYLFYLAQSYKDAEKYALALENYEKYVSKGGAWDQEMFWALLQVAILQEILEKPFDCVVKSYKRAFNYRRSRIEPIFHLARYYRAHNDFESAYRIAKLGLSIPPSRDLLFVQQWMYDWGMQFELSISAYWIGKYEESQSLSECILEKTNLPDDIRATVEGNLGFANAKILEELVQLPDLDENEVTN